jgi:DNA-binding MarR family transcriptional regulator
MDREFRKEEWKALARLYESRFGLFADENIPISLRLLAMFMGMEETKASGIMSGLEKEGLVRSIKKADRPFYFITDKGAEEFEYALR